MNLFGVKLTGNDLILLGVCVTLISRLIWLWHKDRTRKKDIFNTAAKELTDTFYRELQEIYPTPFNWPDDIDSYLRDRFAVLSGAVGKFQNHLPKQKQRDFENAWFRFYCSTNREVDRGSQSYLHYMPMSGSSVCEGREVHYDRSETYQTNLKENVDAILKYAKLS